MKIYAPVKEKIDISSKKIDPNIVWPTQSQRIRERLAQPSHYNQKVNPKKTPIKERVVNFKDI